MRCVWNLFTTYLVNDLRMLSRVSWYSQGKTKGPVDRQRTVYTPIVFRVYLGVALFTPTENVTFEPKLAHKVILHPQHSEWHDCLELYSMIVSLRFIGTSPLLSKRYEWLVSKCSGQQAVAGLFSAFGSRRTFQAMPHLLPHPLTRKPLIVLVLPEPPNGFMSN